MAFNALERTRLLSETFGGERGTQRLAQVLHSMSNPRLPLTLQAPLTLNVSGANSPLVFRNWNPSSSNFTFIDQHGNALGSVSFDPQQGLISTNQNGETIVPVSDQQDQTGTFSGTVQSGSGSGPYEVIRNDTGELVHVEQLQINATQSVPPGTVLPIYRSGNGTYFMQAPVFI